MSIHIRTHTQKRAMGTSQSNTKPQVHTAPLTHTGTFKYMKHAFLPQSRLCSQLVNIKKCDNISLKGKYMLSARSCADSPPTLSDREIHTCCCVIMQSSALERKAVTPTRGRAAPSPPESSLLVLTEMSALYQESYRVACARPCTQSDTFSYHEYGYIPHISHEWGGFVFSSQHPPPRRV